MWLHNNGLQCRVSTITALYTSLYSNHCTKEFKSRKRNKKVNETWETDTRHTYTHLKNTNTE